jgi:hypothetical protein
MRYIHALFDLPWWTGLPIFLLCNIIVPYGLSGYITGCIGCLFGAWIFSKLLNYDVNPDTCDGSGVAISFISLFLGCMYYFTWYCLSWKFDTLFVVRTVTGMLTSLIAFGGFKYK